MEVNHRIAIIPCAGRASRMGDIKLPKALSNIRGKPALHHLLESLDDYFSSYFIPINGDDYEKEVFQKNLPSKFIKKINFIKSIPGSGDGQAVLDAMSDKSFNKNASQVFVCWGDIYINKDNFIQSLISEAESHKTIESMLIPLRKTINPYVAYLFDDKKRISRVAFTRRGEIIEKGLTDLSMFFINPSLIYDSLFELKKLGSNIKVNKDIENELNFLDLIEFLYKKKNPVTYFEPNTEEAIFSFNTLIEADLINKSQIK